LQILCACLQHNKSRVAVHKHLPHRPKKVFWGLVVVLALTSFSVVCGGCKDKRQRPVNVIGSTSIQPFAELLAEEFRALKSAANVDIQGGGSTAGLQALANGIADIAMCSRSLTKEEEASFTPIVIARDGLAVVVHRMNPVNELSSQQIQMLFLGQVGNWKEVGGESEPIRLIMREEGSGTREAFVNLVMDKARVSRKALVQESNGAVKELVKNDPAAIGYMSLGLVGAELKVLSVDGIRPTVSEVSAGRYRLSRPFLFVVKADLRLEAKQFIDFVLSAEGQRLLEMEGLVKAK
jgi:phosphate transport system substrate-binding protein